MRLQGKVALITGAGSGMGRAMAVRFAAEGAKVVAAEWNEKTLHEVVETIRGQGGTAHGVQGNVADREAAEGMVQAALDTYGTLDILMNNAGVMDVNQGVGELDDETYRRVMGINVDGPVFTSRAAVKHMAEVGHGVIVNSASVAAVSGAAAGAAYTMSKHAVIGLTRSTAYVYGPKGIRCNAIIIGAVKTNIQQSVDMSKMDPYGSQRFQAYYGLIPAQLEPEDVANVGLFLASDEAKMVNGALVEADGGWRAA